MFRKRWWLGLLLLVAVGAAVVLSVRFAQDDAPVTSASRATDPERLDTVRFWEHYRSGMKARQAGQWSKAVDSFRQALKLRPDHETSHYYLGSSLFEVGEHEQARIHWQAMIEVNPLSSRAHVQLGTLYSCPTLPDLFDLEKARAHLKRAVELNPEETGPVTRLGEVEFASTNWTRARELLDAARRTNPRAASAHYLCAYLAWQEGRSQDAMDALGSAQEALRVSRAADVPMLEGDTRARDDETVAHETMSAQRLFASLLVGLASNESPSLEEEAARIETYLANLPR